MSWWEAKGFSSLASQALKSAQKQIDKVLDIDEANRDAAKGKSATGKPSKTTADAAPKAAEDDSTPSKEEGNSWNSWGSWVAKPSTDESTQQSAASSSSWNFSSWGFQGESSPKSKPVEPSSAPSSLAPKEEKQPVSSGIRSSSVARKLDLQDSRREEVEEKDHNEMEKKEEDSLREELQVEEVKTNVKEEEEREGGLGLVESMQATPPHEDRSSGIFETDTDASNNDQLCIKTDNDENDRLLASGEAQTDSQSHQAEIIQDETGPPGWSDAAEPEMISSVDETIPSEIENFDDSTNVESSDVIVRDSETVLQHVDEAEPSELTLPDDTDSVVVEKSDTDSQVLPESSDILDEFSANSIAEKTESTITAHEDLADKESDQTQFSAEIEQDVSEHDTSEESPYKNDDVSAPDSAVGWVPEEALSGVPSESSSTEASEVCDTLVSASSSDTLVGGETSFSAQSATEDVQQTSMSSASSDPVLLSMTADEGPACGLEQDQNDTEKISTGMYTNDSSERGDRTSFTAEEMGQNDSQEPDTFSPPYSERDRSSLSTSSFPSDSSTILGSGYESSEIPVSDQSLPHEDETFFHGEAGAAFTEESSSQQWLSISGFGDFDSTASPSASFVKCMIEDAMGMEESLTKHETESGSSEEKSEGSKVDSEFEKSIYSGHESSDDIETTTSSDIEIISTPTPNGEKNIVDLSPLRFSLQKAVRSQAKGHHRSDSQSSSSTHSKGDGDHLSPERDLDTDRHDMGKAPQQHPVAVQDDDLDSPHHPQRLLKSTKIQQDRDVVKKLAETAEILQAREKQLMQLSKDNNDLLETNSILRNQLQQSEASRETEMTDLNALTEEFSRRMGESERKLQSVIKEKEGLKQQLQLAQTELAKRSEDVNLEAMLVEKDEQIHGLMEEGEKLSKQQLQNSNIIKKLRSKEKESESLVTSQKKKLDQQKEELEKLKEFVASKEDMEKKQADAIKQLNVAVQAMERENSKLKAEMEVSEDKIRGLQTTLDNSYKEIAELHKSNASQDSRAQQAALSAEMQVREELKMAMEQQGQQYLREREALIMQIEDLRLSLARMEKEHNRREELLKQENSDLQMRLQEDESRTQDLTQSITSATRPLLRQIENLQATHNIQSSAWERVERSLTERLTEAQTSLALAQEKERMATEKLRDVSSRCTALEATNSQLRHEKAQLAAQQDNSRRRIDLLEERKASEVAQLELVKQKLSDEVASMRKDKVFLEQQLETERNRLEAERQRVSVAEEQIRILERERPRSRGTPSPVSVSRQESMNSSFSERASTPTWYNRGEESDSPLVSVSGPKTSLYDSMRHTGAASLLENLQSQLKLREGEISQLQADIQQLERTRESMARELVNLTNLNEELQEQVEEMPKMQKQFQDLNSRYNAILQMYGEKEEKVQELMLDLEDVKEMYKQQINALMS